jgi:hypothetical protein
VTDPWSVRLLSPLALARRVPEDGRWRRTGTSSRFPRRELQHARVEEVTNEGAPGTDRAHEEGGGVDGLGSNRSAGLTAIFDDRKTRFSMIAGSSGSTGGGAFTPLDQPDRFFDFLAAQSVMLRAASSASPPSVTRLSFRGLPLTLRQRGMRKQPQSRRPIPPRIRSPLPLARGQPSPLSQTKRLQTGSLAFSTSSACRWLVLWVLATTWLRWRDRAPRPSLVDSRTSQVSRPRAWARTGPSRLTWIRLPMPLGCSRRPTLELAQSLCTRALGAPC